MVYIIQTILDHNGDQVACEPSPVRFAHRAQAKQFLDPYIAHVYAEGRVEYEAEPQSWWACDAAASATVHRYTLADEPPMET
jgi:hypothetical protein